MAYLCYNCNLAKVSLKKYWWLLFFLSSQWWRDWFWAVLVRILFRWGESKVFVSYFWRTLEYYCCTRKRIDHSCFDWNWFGHILTGGTSLLLAPVKWEEEAAAVISFWHKSGFTITHKMSLGQKLSAYLNYVGKHCWTSVWKFHEPSLTCFVTLLTLNNTTPQFIVNIVFQLLILFCTVF